MYKVVLKIKLTIVEYIEETQTLEFTYDRPFHTLQRQSKLSINQTESSGKMWQREIVYFNFGSWQNPQKYSQFLISTQQC